MKQLLCIAALAISFVVPVSAQFTAQGSDGYVTTSRIQIGSTASINLNLRMRVDGGTQHGLYVSSTRADGYAIYGRTDASGGIGVQGLALGSNGIGLIGVSNGGVGLLAETTTGLAAEFHGPVKMLNTAGTTELFSFMSNGVMVASGDDPDLTMNMKGTSAFTKLQLRFQVDAVTKADILYDKALNNIVFRHDNVEVMRLSKNGGNYWMEVEKGIRTGRVQTDAALADYVFAEGYTYPTLAEVDSFIQENHHLPGVVSQAEVDEQGGVDLTDFTIQLQEKLEELYLHVIEMDKRIAELEAENAALKEEADTQTSPTNKQP